MSPRRRRLHALRASVKTELSSDERPRILRGASRLLEGCLAARRWRRVGSCTSEGRSARPRARRSPRALRAPRVAVACALHQRVDHLDPIFAVWRRAMRSLFTGLRAAGESFPVASGSHARAARAAKESTMCTRVACSLAVSRRTPVAAVTSSKCSETCPRKSAADAERSAPQRPSRSVRSSNASSESRDLVGTAEPFGHVVGSHLRRMTMVNENIETKTAHRGIWRQLRIGFDDALARLPEGLLAQGFGVITQIDLQQTFKAKLGVDFRRYRIFGACDPVFALQHRRGSARGAAAPVQRRAFRTRRQDGHAGVIDPLQQLGGADERLAGVARTIGERLSAPRRPSTHDRDTEERSNGPAHTLARARRPRRPVALTTRRRPRGLDGCGNLTSLAGSAFRSGLAANPVRCIEREARHFPSRSR